MTSRGILAAGDEKTRGRIRFLLALSLIAAVWLLALPWLASVDSVHKHLQFLEARRINPGAMYYTELEAMTPILQRLHGQPTGAEAPRNRDASSMPRSPRTGD